MASQALLDDNKIVRLLMLLDRKNENRSDLCVLAKRCIYFTETARSNRIPQNKMPKKAKMKKEAEAAMGFREITRVCANRFLKFQNIQQTRS